MPAGRPAGQDHRPGDAMRRTMRSQPIERGVDLRGNLGQRCIWRKRVAGQRRRPAMRIGPRDQVGELVRAIALPVAAVDEHDAGCVRVGGWKQIPGVALAGTVAQVEVLGMRRAECRRVGGAGRVQRGAVGHRADVVVRRVAGGAAHGSPVHSAPSMRRGGMRYCRAGRDGGKIVHRCLCIDTVGQTSLRRVAKRNPPCAVRGGLRFAYPPCG